MEICIPSVRMIENEKKNFHVFAMHIRYCDWEHVVEKRYSEFLELHQVLKLLSKQALIELPKFPKKKYWTRMFGKTAEHLENRRMLLESYMQNVSKTRFSHHCKFFIEFIGMPVRLRDQWNASF